MPKNYNEEVFDAKKTSRENVALSNSILTRENQYQSNDMDKHFRIYCKTVSRLHPRLAENLKKMPNNKGYIFWDMWFLGELESEPGQPLILFKRLENGETEIHEYSYDERGVRTFRKYLKEKRPEGNEDKRGKRDDGKRGERRGEDRRGEDRRGKRPERKHDEKLASVPLSQRPFGTILSSLQ